MYFQDDASEGEECNPDDSEGEIEPKEIALTFGSGTDDLSIKGKKTVKICRHFSYSLIEGAVMSGWEDVEVTNLIKLISMQLNLDETKLIRLLEKTNTGTPEILAGLMDEEKYTFTAPQIVSIVLSNAKSVDHFISSMSKAFDLDLFSISDPNTIEVLYSFTENNMGYRESQRYAKTLCEHCESKVDCGRVLDKFTLNLSEAEGASFIHDIITLDFFHDLEGKMKSFMNEIPRVRTHLEALLSVSHNRNEEGDIVESDEDSQGNLRDFVTNESSGDEDEDRRSCSDDDGEEDDEDDRIYRAVDESTHRAKKKKYYHSSNSVSSIDEKSEEEYDSDAAFIDDSGSSSSSNRRAKRGQQRSIKKQFNEDNNYESEDDANDDEDEEGESDESEEEDDDDVASSRRSSSSNNHNMKKKVQKIASNKRRMVTNKDDGDDDDEDDSYSERNAAVARLSSGNVATIRKRRILVVDDDDDE